MSLSPEQRHVLDALKRIGRQMGASPKEIKAAIETGIVESNLTNPSGGDADSQGWRQERASLYPDPQNLTHSIQRFYNETHAVKGQYGSAGDLAAAVQRPAAQYRGRYQQHSAEADALMGGAGSSAAAAGGTAHIPGMTVTQPTFDAAGFEQARRLALVGQLLAKHNPNSLVLRSGVATTVMPDVADYRGSRTVHVPGSTATRGSAPSSAAHNAAALKELFWQGPGGIDVKNGQVEPQGFVSGHTDHVHVATLSDAARAQVHRLAEHFGLKATSTGSGAHANGSYHYQRTAGGKSGAVDYAGDPQAEARFAAAVARLFRVRR